jgi:hypothetical protein
VSAIKAEAEKKAQKFTNDGRVRFPWQVLIATAIRGSVNLSARDDK